LVGTTVSRTVVLDFTKTDTGSSGQHWTVDGFPSLWEALSRECPPEALGSTIGFPI
jgi:hypothetical protein